MGMSLLDRGLSFLADTYSVAATYNDDVALKFGTGGTVSLIYETADPNANALLFVAPEGGSVDVPVFVFGDASILNADLGFFNGITEPQIAILDDGADHWALFGFASDGVAQIKTNGSLALMTGDYDDYITFSTAANIPTITATGAAYLLIDSELRIGSNTFYSGALVPSGHIFPLVSGLKLSIEYLGDADSFIFVGKDAGVGLAEVARIQNAADPYFQILRDDTGVSLSTVTDGLVLGMGGGGGIGAAGMGFGISFLLDNAASVMAERGYLDLKLDVATNGAESAHFILGTQFAGVMSSTDALGRIHIGRHAPRANFQDLIFFNETITNPTGTHALGIEANLLIKHTAAPGTFVTTQTIYSAVGTSGGNTDNTALYMSAVRGFGFKDDATHIGGIAVFFSDCQLSAGTIDELSHYQAAASTVTGAAVTVEYGFLSGNGVATGLEHGTTKWAFYATVDKSFFGGQVRHGNNTHFGTSVDSAAAADTVTIGGYEISAGHRALAIGSEEVVVAAAGVASTEKYPVRINGVTKYVMLCA